MRDRMNPPIGSLLSPADGFEPRHELFSESPIEALDWLKELGKIAKDSIDPEVELAPPPAAAAEIDPEILYAPEPAPAPSEESKIVEALLEYHRLRNPAFSSRTAAARSGKGMEFTRVDSSAKPSNHFAPLDIPVVKNAAPKAAGSPLLRPPVRK